MLESIGLSGVNTFVLGTVGLFSIGALGLSATDTVSVRIQNTMQQVANLEKTKTSLAPIQIEHERRRLVLQHRDQRLRQKCGLEASRLSLLRTGLLNRHISLGPLGLHVDKYIGICVWGCARMCGSAYVHSM